MVGRLSTIHEHAAHLVIILMQHQNLVILLNDLYRIRIGKSPRDAWHDAPKRWVVLRTKTLELGPPRGRQLDFTQRWLPQARRMVWDPDTFEVSLSTGDIAQVNSPRGHRHG